MYTCIQPYWTPQTHIRFIKASLRASHASRAYEALKGLHTSQTPASGTSCWLENKQPRNDALRTFMQLTEDLISARLDTISDMSQPPSEPASPWQ